MHRTRIDGRVPVADMHLEVMGAPSPDPDLTITPAQARALAVELMERADAAEGHGGPLATRRMGVLMQLRNFEEQAAKLLAGE